MAAKKILMTPKGSAEWVKLFTPDFKFEKLGLYSLNLKVAEDEAEALTTELSRQVDACYNAKLKENPKLKNKMVKRLPYEQLLNDDGEDTGFIEFKIKMKARVEMKDGTSFTQKPAVFDAKGKPITEAIKIGNGSICKVAFEPVPYMLASTKEASLSLRLKSVQLVELRDFTGVENPFDTEEGYEFEEPKEPTDHGIFTKGDFPTDGEEAEDYKEDDF